MSIPLSHRSDCAMESSCISRFCEAERLPCPKASSAWRPLTFKPDNWVDFPLYDNHVVMLQKTELITSTLPLLLLDCHLDHQRISLLRDIYTLFLLFFCRCQICSRSFNRDWVLSTSCFSENRHEKKIRPIDKPSPKTASSISRSQMNTKKSNCRSIKLEFGVNQNAKAERRKSVDKNKIYGWGSPLLK